MINYNPSETKEYDQDIMGNRRIADQQEIIEKRKKCANKQEIMDKNADKLCKKKKKT